MHTQENTSPALGDYVEMRGLLLIPCIQSNYRTIDALRWFVRRHRALLVARRAMIMVAGQQRFHPALFEQTVIDAGLLAAAAKEGASHG